MDVVVVAVVDDGGGVQGGTAELCGIRMRARWVPIESCFAAFAEPALLLHCCASAGVQSRAQAQAPLARVSLESDVAATTQL